MEFDYNLNRQTLPTTIADSLETTILASDYSEKEKLPSEQTLADNFGVSRPVIREAIKILCARGLVVQKTGEGNFVSEVDTSFVINAVNRYVQMNRLDINYVFEVRSNLETMAAKLAAERGSEEDFETLRSINEEMERNMDSIEDRTNLDIEFHAQVARISKNPLLESFILSMANILHEIFMKSLYTSPEGNLDGIEFHKRIIDALMRKNPDEAERIMRAHMDVSLAFAAKARAGQQ